MRTFKLLLLFTLFFTACQKETSLEIPDNQPGNNGNNNNPGGPGGTSNGSEIGTWNFVSSRVIMNATMSGFMGGMVFKSISKSDMTSINNSGTVVFDGKTMEFKKVFYTYKGTMTNEIYLDGQKLSSENEPVDGSQPWSDKVLEYKKVSTDSLYFPDGIASSMGPNGVNAGPGGATLKWDENKMYVTIPAEIIYSDNSSGEIMNVLTKTTMIITLQKP